MAYDKAHSVDCNHFELRMLGISDSLRCDLPCATTLFCVRSAPQYTKVMQPPSDLGFQDVCNFVMVAAESGMTVECTAIEGMKEVKVKQVQRVAHGCGATDFRVRKWIPEE